MPPFLRSNICNQAQFESQEFRGWAPRLGTSFCLHRKLWEWCYIAQALYERGMLVPGRRGLGFAVGREPLVALFASMGCEIVATDLDEAQARDAGWVDTNQHAARVDVLNERGLCDPDAFRRRVTYRSVDMNQIPADLRGFDFTWSSCSFEHLGTIERGKQFIVNMMDCLKPGGVAVHTTEYNVLSNVHTLDNNPNTVIFRRCDIEDMARRLTRSNHRINLDFSLGTGPADVHVEVPPYESSMVLKFVLGGFISTSMGLIIEKDRAGLTARSLERLAAAVSLLRKGA